MSYCIAFSTDGATDVTRRYVRNATTQGAPRNKCPEEVLLYITNEIRQMRRRDMDKDDRKRLIIQDEREEKELRGYVIQNLAAEIGRMIPLDGKDGAAGTDAKRRGSAAAAAASPSAAADGTAGPPDDKLPAARTTGTQQWREARGEAGRTGPAPDHMPPRREGH